ncbi:PTS transporter subunit EIIC [Streptomyces sp. NPDC005820]|uniref:PTS transporter subunit EIIC n=1 Tax=Streptomyces sp. NPDC005820 TaxID=3157069 RepID=UPI0033C9E3C5
MSTPKDSAHELAAAILPLVGGSANITTVAHCMTRLRLGLADPTHTDEPALRALPGVLGVVVTDDTWQVVLGPGVVTRVTAAFQRLTTPESQTTEPSAGPLPPERTLKATLRRLAAVFVPLIPALIGCGILAGLNGLLVNAGLLPGLTPALAAVASAFMALIPVFVGHNTAKEFGGTPVLGGAVAAIVVLPGVAKVTAFGVHLSPGQGGVLGALAAALLATRVERWCRGRVPDALDVLLTPTLTVLVAGLGTLYGIMYAAGAVSSAIGTAANWLLATTGAVAGLVLGGLFLPLVMLGLHQALIPIHTTLIDQQGYTVLLPVLAMAGAGQVGAALAVYARLRHAPSPAPSADASADASPGTSPAPSADASPGTSPGASLGDSPGTSPGASLGDSPGTSLGDSPGASLGDSPGTSLGDSPGASLGDSPGASLSTSLRTTIRSALPAGLLGVGEPLIYGVSLPLGRPFLTACAGGAAGGAFIGFFAMLGDRVGATAIGPSGWALFPLLAGNRGLGVTAAIYAGGLLTGYAVGFAATYAFGGVRAAAANATTCGVPRAPTPSRSR